jgi:hypothetical protein
MAENNMKLRYLLLLTSGLCSNIFSNFAFTQTDDLISSSATRARAANGEYIGWREHLIDDEASSGIELRGSDGLILADLDQDGFIDVISVHESDDQYDGVPEGHVRIAFGSADPDVWYSITLAEGAEAGAAEDVAVGDVNGDGFLDLVVACELSHLIYFQNPGQNIRDSYWPRVIPSNTLDRGSFIRVFLADFNGDGKLEVAAPNKGAQDPTQARQEPKQISIFEIPNDPLDGDDWIEHELTQVPWPINSEPVDLDGDGDMDIVGGTVAETRMMWFENRSENGQFNFVEHTIETVAGRGIDSGNILTSSGFNMDYVDINHDGRLDIVTMDTPPLLGRRLIWLEQPENSSLPWKMHLLGSFAPDSIVGIRLSDIDGDGDADIMTGGYSLGSRLEDNVAEVGNALGRLAWWENPDDINRDWIRHDFSRRERGMFDKFESWDMDGDGDVDFVSTRGNSGPYDGVFWLEQVRSATPIPRFEQARAIDSPEYPLASELP